LPYPLNGREPDVETRCLLKRGHQSKLHGVIPLVTPHRIATCYTTSATDHSWRGIMSEFLYDDAFETALLLAIGELEEIEHQYARL
jgi:hypothetical protein